MNQGPTKKIATADTMNTRELAAHQRKGGIVLLPLGCVEMHGVHAPVSCDSFLAEAACRILAEEWDAVILPTIHYCYPGATTPWPGTISITPRETMDYIVAVMKAIFRNGFKRLVLVSLHGPNNSMIEIAMRSVFEETGELPIFFAPRYYKFSKQLEELYGQNHDEAAHLLAAMYICGRHGEFDPSASKAETLEGPAYPFPELGKLRQRDVIFPFWMTKPNQHVGRYPGLTLADAPKLAELYRKYILETAVGLPAEYESYQKKMRNAMKAAPWEKFK